MIFRLDFSFYKAYISLSFAQNNPAITFLTEREIIFMKATGIVRRIDDLGRVVIPKEIRRTMRIREGDPPLTTLTVPQKVIIAVNGLYYSLGR